MAERYPYFALGQTRVRQGAGKPLPRPPPDLRIPQSRRQYFLQVPWFSRVLNVKADSARLGTFLRGGCVMKAYGISVVRVLSIVSVFAIAVSHVVAQVAPKVGDMA